MVLSTHDDNISSAFVHGVLSLMTIVAHASTSRHWNALHVADSDLDRLERTYKYILIHLIFALTPTNNYLSIRMGKTLSRFVSGIWWIRAIIVRVVAVKFRYVDSSWMSEDCRGVGTAVQRVRETDHCYRGLSELRSVSIGVGSSLEKRDLTRLRIICEGLALCL